MAGERERRSCSVLFEKKSFGDLYFNISKTNYEKLFKYKEVLNYVNFFKKNYFASENKN